MLFEDSNDVPGQVVQVTKDSIVVQTGHGLLKILQLQLE